jgi:hypothetical protein
VRVWRNHRKGNIWLEVFPGILVMVILNTVLPMMGMVIGGIVAGCMAGGGFQNGAKAVFVAGLVGAVIITFLFLIGAHFLLGGVFFVGILERSLLFLILLFPFTGLLGIIGGIIGGVLRSRILED